MSGPAMSAPATSAVTAVPVTAPEPCRPGLRRACPGAPGAVTVDRSRLRPASLLIGFSLAAVGAGTARGLTTTYLPVLLERINDAPILIGAVLTVNAVAGLVVPFAVGAWSDRREDTGLGRRLPFMVGGTVLGAMGLVAIAVGNASSYIALALAAALVYTGLNALTTLHRALVVDDVTDDRRPAVTSAQELAGTLGAGIAVGLGAALIEPAPELAFVLGALVLVAATVPTVVIIRRLGLETGAHSKPVNGWRESLGGALRLPGAREVLLAQALWVFAYAALPGFFVLYAIEELGMSVGIAGALPLAFGALVAVGMVLAGRVASDDVHHVLLASAALLGVGLLVASPASTLALAAPGLAAAALGAGVLTAIGFPYFARFIPGGEEGIYSGAFFGVRGIAAVVALPVAGAAVELSGSYRSVLWLGAGALVAVVPLLAAERRRAAQSITRPLPATVAAVMPVFGSARAAAVAGATLEHVDELVVVADGAPAEITRSLSRLAEDERVRLLSLPNNGGKGTAVAAGIDDLLRRDEPPAAIVVLDSDGQHDPERIPALVAASAGADVVVGWRRSRPGMPLVRRFGNRVASLALLASTGVWLPDTQNGMRLFHTDALREVPMPPGGYEAESRHLRALISARRWVASVEVPTIYDGEPSHFRPGADTIGVARALLAPPGHGGGHAKTTRAHASLNVVREWAPRLIVGLVTVILLGAALPLFQPLDNELFLAINGLGDGPEWLYQALDPHTRNYALLVLGTMAATAVLSRRPRYVFGAALAMVLAALLANVTWEVVKLFVERARPEEVLGSQVDLSHDRTWSHIGSYPSGHMLVTTALAATAASIVPALRWPLVAYVAVVAATRLVFGAHFPIDVLVGIVVGYELGRFSATLIASAGQLPQPRSTTVVAARAPPSLREARS